MKMLVAAQPAVLNEKKLLLGNENGMSFLEDLDGMKKDIAALRSQQEEDRRRLHSHQLEPAGTHIKHI